MSTLTIRVTCGCAGYIAHPSESQSKTCGATLPGPRHNGSQQLGFVPSNTAAIAAAAQATSFIQLSLGRQWVVLHSPPTMHDDTAENHHHDVEPAHPIRQAIIGTSLQRRPPSLPPPHTALCWLRLSSGLLWLLRSSTGISVTLPGYYVAVRGAAQQISAEISADVLCSQHSQCCIPNIE
jgi:hypothetical protein